MSEDLSELRRWLLDNMDTKKHNPCHVKEPGCKGTSEESLGRLPACAMCGKDACSNCATIVEKLSGTPYSGPGRVCMSCLITHNFDSYYVQKTYWNQGFKVPLEWAVAVLAFEQTGRQPPQDQDYQADILRMREEYSSLAQESELRARLADLNMEDSGNRNFQAILADLVQAQPSEPMALPARTVAARREPIQRKRHAILSLAAPTETEIEAASTGKTPEEIEKEVLKAMYESSSTVSW